MQNEVVHNKSENRFEVRVEGGLAVTGYFRDGKRIVFTHTEVPPEAEGKGVGNALAKTALDYAREEGLRVVPRCPFVAAYIKRHPEYQELLDKNEGS